MADCDVAIELNPTAELYRLRAQLLQHTNPQQVPPSMGTLPLDSFCDAHTRAVDWLFWSMLTPTHIFWG